MSIPKPSHTHIGIVFRFFIVALTSLAFGSIAKATPYASGLTNNAGTVSFVLNEAADEVKIIFGGTTNSLGAQPAGTVTAAVGASNPFSVLVSKISGSGYKTTVTNNPGALSIAGKIQISTDPLLSRFPTPRGLAVNRNPASPFFGRVYVANSTAGTTATRPVGRGLYVVNADFSDSPNGYGNTAQTGGLTFAVSANSPYRLSVGQDDFVYIADFSDANGNVYRTDGNLQNGAWVFDVVGGPATLPEGQNHGSTLKAVAEGSLATSNLKVYTIDEDYGSVLNNDLWRYDIDSGPLTNTAAPTLLSSALIGGFSIIDDFCKGGTNGYIYLMQNRASPATVAALYILDSTGAVITDSQTLWRAFTGNPTATDVLTNLNSIAISADGNYLAAVLQGTGNSDTFIIPLTNGIPDLSQLKILDTGTVTQGRGIDFDAVGNIYTVSSGDAVLRSFSPGGISAILTGSSGALVDLTPTVSLTVNSNFVSEGTSFILTVSRSGDSSAAVTATYSLQGTASNGSDYSLLSGTLTFAPGQTTTNLTVNVTDDSGAEFTETIIAAIVQSTNYAIGASASATISILDNETPELSPSPVASTMYERLAGDYTSVMISRRGRLDVALPTINLAYSGAASPSRYSAPSSTSLDAGVVTAVFQIAPVDDAVFIGDQTIIVTVTSGSGYVPGATNSASVTILDDEYPAETTLFVDPLTSDTSANWKTNFGANNLIDDYFVDFIADLGGDLVSLPPNGSSTALKVYVNRNEPTAGGAAGINLYPNGQTFGGDFALRFNMYIAQNSSAGTTEFALFGINHSGNKTNWIRQTGTTPNNPPLDTDGLWFSVISDGSGSSPADFALFTSTNPANQAVVLKSATAVSLAQVFKKPPYNAALPGTPANLFATTGPWSDVEVKKVGSVVTMSINKTPIIVYTNATAFTNGNIMLGYMDPYESIGSAGGAAYFSNVRVVQLAVPQPSITKIQLINSGTQVQVDFAGGAGDTTGSFKLQSSTLVNGTYSDDNTAIITSPSAGTFRFVTSVSGSTQFYKIRHL
jgi:hypothetical protein